LNFQVCVARGSQPLDSLQQITACPKCNVQFCARSLIGGRALCVSDRFAGARDRSLG
jgi:hypothetical protein